jgi:hypothetical protein
LHYRAVNSVRRLRGDAGLPEQNRNPFQRTIPAQNKTKHGSARC